MSGNASISAMIAKRIEWIVFYEDDVLGVLAIIKTGTPKCPR
jgi:hypothetical protein